MRSLYFVQQPNELMRAYSDFSDELIHSVIHCIECEVGTLLSLLAKSNIAHGNSLFELCQPHRELLEVMG